MVLLGMPRFRANNCELKCSERSDSGAVCAEFNFLQRLHTLVDYNARRHVGEYRAAREKVIGNDVLPTSTLVIVNGLASPDILIEVEAWAAKA